MIRASIATIRAIEKGVNPSYVVVIDFQQPETYDMDGLLISVGDISQSMSGDGVYEIQNTTVTLKNEKFYFSRKFARELPDNRPVTIYLKIGDELIEFFRGLISSGWTLSAVELSLSVHA